MSILSRPYISAADTGMIPSPNAFPMSDLKVSKVLLGYPPIPGGDPGDEVNEKPELGLNLGDQICN